MDSPWEEGDDQHSHRDVEWSRISSNFTNAGYREGITAGKESALQEGFDAGYAQTGVPLGHKIGLLRGIANAITGLLAQQDQPALLQEARDISSRLSAIRFSDIAPRDLEAEEHARQHLEAEGEGLDENEEIAERRKMEGIEDMLAQLTSGTANGNDGKRPTIDDVGSLEQRLRLLTEGLGLGSLWDGL